MKKHLTAGSLILMAAGLIIAGGEPWKTKPYDQWDQKDVLEILQGSPWAKVIPNVGGTLHLQGNENLGSSGAVVGEGGSGTAGASGVGTVLPGEHEQTLNDPRAPKTYVVVWWSAKTVREAAAQRSVLLGRETEDVAKSQVAAGPGDYEIMVHGADMSIFDQRTEQSFMTTVYIQLKSNKEKIPPSRVEYTRDSNGRVSAAIFHFPLKNASGSPTIPPGEKRVDFYAHVGDGNIITGFDVTKMVDKQGVDL